MSSRLQESFVETKYLKILVALTTFDSKQESIKNIKRATKSLEALPVDDGRTGLIVLLLRDPQLLEGVSQDGASDPD